MSLIQKYQEKQQNFAFGHDRLSQTLILLAAYTSRSSAHSNSVKLLGRIRARALFSSLLIDDYVYDAKLR